MTQDTIYALSSGGVPSGVAVVRLSGPKAGFILEKTVGPCPNPRYATLRMIRDAQDMPIDQGLVLWFPAPHSFTGEACAEFHLHGGPAVLSRLLDTLNTYPQTRPAEPGEFMRRAFENGKLDLVAVEGVADLLQAQTQAQHQQALRQMRGELSKCYERWRATLITCRGYIEAHLDFSDQEDVPEDVSAQIWPRIQSVYQEIKTCLEDAHRGEQIRSGVQIMLMGRPNVGKSSLLNALAQRDVAIVTEEAGTTRDLLEVHLDLRGYPLTLIDTAGLRERQERVEKEGARRALHRMREADLILWLEEKGRLPEVPKEIQEGGIPVWWIQTKADLCSSSADDDTPDTELVDPPTLKLRRASVPGAGLCSNSADANLCGFPFARSSVSITTLSSDGITPLCTALSDFVVSRFSATQTPLITRARHRKALQECAAPLQEALETPLLPLECRAELLRCSCDQLGRITGKIHVDDFLDVIFRDFCIGK